MHENIEKWQQCFQLFDLRWIRMVSARDRIQNMNDV